MRYSFPTGVFASPYPCSPGLMGSTSDLAIELGNKDRDHSTIDGRIVYCHTLYARMNGVQKIDMGSSLIEVLPMD